MKVLITENGIPLSYNEKLIKVPDPNLQNKTATENGTYTADEGFDGIGEIFVNVEGDGGYPEPTGTTTITTNGTHDVKDFATAEVNVPEQIKTLETIPETKEADMIIVANNFYLWKEV